MAKDDQQEAYEKAVSANLVRVTDWLKFAETKNAALLAFTSAWTVAIGNILTKGTAIPPEFAGVLPVSGCLFLIAAVTVLYSFMPRFVLSKFYKGDQAISRPLNLLFYGDISSIPMTEYPTRLFDRYMPQKNQTARDEYLADLACQIHVNSGIATRKYFLFKIGSWITLLSMVILAWPAVRYLLVGGIRLLVEFAK